MSGGDREEARYVRGRADQRRRRANLEREQFDPAPPGEDDWTVGDEDSDRVRRVTAPAPLGEVLARVVGHRKGWQERLRGSTTWSRWEDIVGPALAARCEPVRVAGGTLVVRAENEVWATQLRYLGAQITSNAGAVLGPGVVTRVRIVVGPLTGTVGSHPPGEDD